MITACCLHRQGGKSASASAAHHQSLFLEANGLEGRAGATVMQEVYSLAYSVKVAARLVLLLIVYIYALYSI
jgi:hypothetical protein